MFAVAASCGGDRWQGHGDDIVDSYSEPLPGVCSPLMQTGCHADEKCTWIVDATTPMYVGHIGCVPDGTARLGSACEYGAPGATGYDNCMMGGVCSAYAHPGSAGVCDQICDNQGGSPMCDAMHACAGQSQL